MSLHDGKAGDPAIPSRRRRNFLASLQNDGIGSNILPVRVEEDDVPILTEIVLGSEKRDEALASGETTKPNVQVVFDGSLEELATQMTRAITEQMAYELPTLIEATLLTISEELRNGITSTMEAALRNFITRHKPSSSQNEPPG
jgi:hypothetical protein